MRQKRSVAEFRGEYEGNTENAASLIEERYGVVIPAESIQLVQFLPFEIRIFVDYELMQKRQARGLHYRGTPLSLISTGLGEEQTLLTERHESTHNILDGSGEFSGHYGARRYIERHFERFENSPQGGVIQKMWKQRLLNVNATDVFNLLNDEFLAEVQSAEEKSFDSLDPKSVLFQIFGQSYANSSLLKSIASVSVPLDALIKYVQEKGNEIDDPEIKAFCNTLAVILKDHVADAVGQLRMDLRLAEKLGEDAHTKVHALMYILKPSQYRHIEGYLAHSYGQDRMDLAKKSIALLDNVDASQGWIDQVKELTADGRIEFSEEEKKKIIREYEDALSDRNNFDLENISQVRDYMVDIESALSVLGMEHDDLERMKLDVVYIFITQKMVNGLFSDTAQIYQEGELTPDEIKLFIGVLESELFDEGVFYRGNTLEDLQQSSLWDVIKELEMDQRVIELWERDWAESTE